MSLRPFAVAISVFSSVLLFGQVSHAVTCSALFSADHSNMRRIEWATHELEQAGLLNEELTYRQKIAVIEAFNIGYGFPGANGQSAGPGNWTHEQLNRKRGIILMMGFDAYQWRVLRDTVFAVPETFDWVN